MCDVEALFETLFTSALLPVVISSLILFVKSLGAPLRSAAKRLCFYCEEKTKMSSGTPFIGSKLSLISKAEIRYEGILYAVDTKDATVTLSKVRSYGTEDRPVPKPIPPRSEVYEYIIFRGSDIKDLNVSEMPKEEEPPIDPAIVSAHHSMPTVAASQNLPPLPPAGVHSMQQSASLPNQSQPPLPTHPPPPSGFSPFGPMGGYNPFGVPYFRPVMMGQGLPHLSSHAPPGAPPGQPFLHSQQQPTSNSVTPPTTTPTLSDTAQSTISGAIGYTSTPLSIVGESVLEATKTDEDGAMSSSCPSVIVPSVTEPSLQEPQQPILSVITTSDVHKLLPTVNKPSPPPTATTEDFTTIEKESTGAKPATAAKSGDKGWNDGGKGGRGGGRRQNNYYRGSRGYNRSGGYEGYNNAGSGNWSHQRPWSGEKGRRYGRDDKPQNATGGENQKQPIRYDSEFDFETANARFNRDQLEEEMKQKLKISDNQSDSSQRERTVAEEDPLIAQESSETGPPECYDKSKSFFDSISCESTQSEGNRRSGRNHEYALNTETFGVTGRGYRGQGRYRGYGYRGGRGRGGYNYRGGRGGYNYRGGGQQHYSRGGRGRWSESSDRGRSKQGNQQQEQHAGNETTKD